MASEAKRQKKNYVTWSNEERMLLIKKRIERDPLFTCKNANSNEAWRIIAEELSDKMGAGKDAINCKLQWNALCKKYKKFFAYTSGEGTGEEATTEDAQDWVFFELMHSYASQKDNYHPPFLIDSTEGAFSMRQEDSPKSASSVSPRPTTAALGSTPPEPRPSTSRSVAQRETPRAGSREDRFSKLERHIYRRDKKINKKITSLLSIFGQMVQTDYPHIDASALLVTSSSDSDD